MSDALHVLAPGLLTTVQDRGRSGWRHLGVPLAGALDPMAMALANRLVGNHADAALLELSLQGPRLQLLRSLRIALVGAAVQARFEGVELPDHRPIELPAGVLELGGMRTGARAWLVIGGGIDVPSVLGSRSTDLRGGFGGLNGRALQRGDRLALVAPPALDCRQPRIARWWVEPDADLPVREGEPLAIRYRPGAHPRSLELATHAWQIDAASNRQGLRLHGPALPGDTADGVSAPVAPGTIQLPADGQPIVLLADAQTVGGYTRLGHVIAADLPRLAQCRPGEALRFVACDAETAHASACRSRTQLARMALMIEMMIERDRKRASA
ncbi:5-oxoprolinase subunit C family protein [Novilysobacter erysipheiresistens]|uniref:Biotin-dependent carboxyltransferase family protein n=1 Tax=Novilysobacter erysipheiresistens TaxID=1749332 RepID=A0ABU7YZV1_9GAMM